jgi:sulfopyruvate decarboxylase alpha subunit
MSNVSNRNPWPNDVFQVLVQYQVRQVAFVPDAGHADLIRLCGECDEMLSVPLTSEEEGVALLAGAWLGGERGVLLLQSSGVGTCLNMLALPRVCRMPLLLLVTMRGEWGEFNPWQVPMGQTADRVLTLAGVITFPVSEPTQVAETVAAAARMAFEGPAATAVLISQRIVGAKTFGQENAQPGRA